jgi:hypothetical protein
MGMLMHPSGPLPPAVYWRRRLAVALTVIIVIVLIVVIWKAASGGGKGKNLPTTPVSSSASATAICPKGSLGVTLVADQTNFPSPAKPSFHGEVTNTGKTACNFDTSQAGWTLAITSGSDRIYSSADCSSPVMTPQPTSLSPGKSASFPVNWNRTRSNSQCAKQLPSPRPGTYKATLTAAGNTSPQATFTLS